jgi:hypothetical protein
MGQRQSVHRARHLNVREQYSDIVVLDHELFRNLGVSGLEYRESRVFENLRGHHQQHGFVFDDEHRYWRKILAHVNVSLAAFCASAAREGAVRAERK